MNLRQLIFECFSSIREEAERAERLLKETSYEALRRQALEEGQICHGEYIHHNLLVAGGHMTVINFEKFSVDVQNERPLPVHEKGIGKAEL